jgi:hypothetical protein
MIDDTHPELSPSGLGETDERLAESATEFCAALDRYERAMQSKKDKQ